MDMIVSRRRRYLFLRWNPKGNKYSTQVDSLRFQRAGICHKDKSFPRNLKNGARRWESQCSSQTILLVSPFPSEDIRCRRWCALPSALEVSTATAGSAADAVFFFSVGCGAGDSHAGVG